MIGFNFSLPEANIFLRINGWGQITELECSNNSDLRRRKDLFKNPSNAVVETAFEKIIQEYPYRLGVAIKFLKKSKFKKEWIYKIRKKEMEIKKKATIK